MFLRMYPVEEKSGKEVGEILNWVFHLRKNGYPAMEPVPMKDGSFLKEMDTIWGRYVVSAFYGVQGDSLEDQEVTDALLFAYGSGLGKLHACPNTDASFAHHTEFLDQIEERMKKYASPTPVFAEFEKVKKALSALPVDQTQYGLVHYDFEAGNVFFEPASQKFSVIDFDDVKTLWYALDVVRALDSIEELVPPENLAKAQELFLLAYRTEHPFTLEQEAQLPWMRRLVNLQHAVDLRRTLSDIPSENPDWLIELREKLQKKLDNLEASMA